MKYIFKTLKEIRNKHILKAGNKAYHLALIEQKSLNIPQSAVLIPDKNGYNAEYFIEKIKNRFDFPWILRSSAQNEDSEKQSFAGIYKSIKINNPDEFLKAINDFSVPPEVFTVLNPYEFTDPAVLIQPYITFEKAGVMFIPDPWSRNTYYAEAGNPHEITDGTIFKTMELGENEKKPLNDVAKTVKSFFSWKYADVEWGFLKDKLFILQIRPLNFKPENLYGMDRGVWIRDVHHNPDPLSPAHESLIKFICSLYPGYLGIYMHHLYYTQAPPAFREITRKNKFIPEEISEVLNDFAKFTIKYISAPEKPNENEGKNLLLSSAKLFWRLFLEKHGKITRIDQNIIKKDEIFRQFLDFTGNLPFKWDISSPVLKEKTDLLTSFLLKHLNTDEITKISDTSETSGKNPFKNNKNISSGEIDDVYFANELYKIRKIFLKKGKELLANKKINNLNDVFFFEINELYSLNDFSKNALEKTLNIRKQLIKQKNQILPDKLIDGKPMYNRKLQKEFHKESFKYKGISLTRGKVTGIIRKVESVIKSSHENKNTILVFKSVTPNDILYIAESAGFITESSIKTSHALIAALELDIPAIAGIDNASEIPEGTEVLLDADNGFLQISN